MHCHPSRVGRYQMTPPLKLCAIEPRASIQPQAMSSTCAWEEWRSQHYSPHVGTLRLMFSNVWPAGPRLPCRFPPALLQLPFSFISVLSQVPSVPQAASRNGQQLGANWRALIARCTPRLKVDNKVSC
mmetsp:Transcript_18962/g.32421  ORF Transcript_18962/g.32421 Transcript_18962/m.32421 type:complete len:128 (+) Transcript_18962:282-665(+)